MAAAPPANILTYNKALSQGTTAANQAASYIQKNAPAPSGQGTASQTRNTPVSSSGGGSNAYQNVQPILQQNPPQPSFDPKPYDDLLSSLSSLGDTFKTSEGSAETAINQNENQQLQSLGNQRDIAQQSQDVYANQAKTDAESNINQQRRMQSEIAQGIQARYGGSTGTGAFVEDLTGRQTTTNVANLKTQLAHDLTKVSLAKSQLDKDYSDNYTAITNNSSQLIAQAKNNLNQMLAQLETQRAQVGISKAQQQSALLSHYQDQVAAIQANNTQYLQTLQQQTLAVQNKLSSAQYSLQYQGQNLDQLIKQANTIKQAGFNPTVNINKNGDSSLSFSPAAAANNPAYQPVKDQNGNVFAYFNPTTGQTVKYNQNTQQQGNFFTDALNGVSNILSGQ